MKWNKHNNQKLINNSNVLNQSGTLRRNGQIAERQERECRIISASWSVTPSAFLSHTITRLTRASSETRAHRRHLFLNCCIALWGKCSLPSSTCMSSCSTTSGRGDGVCPSHLESTANLVLSQIRQRHRRESNLWSCDDKVTDFFTTWELVTITDSHNCSPIRMAEG